MLLYNIVCSILYISYYNIILPKEEPISVKYAEVLTIALGVV